MNYFHTIDISLEKNTRQSNYLVQILTKYNNIHPRREQNEWIKCLDTDNIKHAEEFIQREFENGSIAIYRIIELRTEVRHRGECFPMVYTQIPGYKLELEKFDSKEFYESTAVR